MVLIRKLKEFPLTWIVSSAEYFLLLSDMMTFRYPGSPSALIVSLSLLSDYTPNQCNPIIALSRNVITSNFGITSQQFHNKTSGNTIKDTANSRHFVADFCPIKLVVSNHPLERRTIWNCLNVLHFCAKAINRNNCRK